MERSCSNGIATALMEFVLVVVAVTGLRMVQVSDVDLGGGRVASAEGS
jgi:hypothetical protein